MSDLPIPMVDLALQHRELREDLDAAINAVLESSAFIGGEACRRFEEDFAAFCRAESACGVANGSDAVFLALLGLGVGPGDEVVTTPFTFVATTEAISRVGAKIVFADVDLETFDIDPAVTEAVVTPRTRVILPVHLYGLSADMNALSTLAARTGAMLVEDAAQAHGAELEGRRVGTFGRIGCFSFYPAKNLGAMGDAGAVVSNDGELVESIRRLADHGSTAKYLHAREGVSSRLDGLQAAILSVKLGKLEGWNEKRRLVADRYRDGLSSLEAIALPTEPSGRRHVYHQFTIRVEPAARDPLKAHLGDRGIASAVHYPRPLHLQEAYRHLGLAEGSLPQAERAAREVLSLPMYPELLDEQIDRVIEAVRAFF